MNELIQVNYDNDQPTVSGRELHKALGIRTAYKDWFPRMCQYGFTEGVDFNPINFEQVRLEGSREVKRIVDDHLITISMAKELCMLQRSELGKKFRQYFIQVEDAWNSPEQVMARALQMAERTSKQWQENCQKLYLQVREQHRMIESMQSKVRYVDEILQSDSLVLTTQIAKDYGMGAKTLNQILNQMKIQYRVGEQWVLYAKYQDKGYTCSRTFRVQRQDGVSIVKMQTEWTQKGRLFLYDALKAENIYPLVEKEGENSAGGNQ